GRTAKCGAARKKNPGRCRAANPAPPSFRSDRASASRETTARGRQRAVRPLNYSVQELPLRKEQNALRQHPRKQPCLPARSLSGNRFVVQRKRERKRGKPPRGEPDQCHDP